MATVKVLNMEGAEAGTIELDDTVKFLKKKFES